MMPVVRGDAETARQIVIYTLLLFAVSLLLFPTAGMGLIYLVAAIALGAAFVWYALRVLRDASDGKAAIGLFRYSISYLTLLFAAVAVDSLIRPQPVGARSRAAASASSRASSAGGASVLVPHPGRHHARHGDQEHDVTEGPHEDAAQVLVDDRAGTPRPQRGQVVREQHHRGAHQRHAQERVLRHGQEEVEEADRVGEAPSAPDRLRPPATRTAAPRSRKVACWR